MQYDPTKVPLVDKLLAKFPDEQVAERLSQKYGVSPVPKLTDVHTFKSSMGMGMIRARAILLTLATLHGSRSVGSSARRAAPGCTPIKRLHTSMKF